MGWTTIVECAIIDLIETDADTLNGSKFRSFINHNAGLF